jgi:UDP:flavonoid glycosyltransferase YjiC (YdhE family)
MRVLCSCLAASGHLFPMFPLAEELRAHGHHVAFMSGPEAQADLDGLGLDLLVSDPPFGSVIAEALSRYPDNKFRTGTFEESSRFAFHRLFGEMRVEFGIDTAVTKATAFAPDLIVNDEADFIGPLVAAILNVPNATSGYGWVTPEEWVRLGADGAARSWRAVGLNPRADGGLYRSLYVNRVPRSIQRSLPSGVATVDLRPIALGEGLPLPADLDHLGVDRRLVYVTFGTAFGDRAPAQELVEALAQLDVDVILTTGSRWRGLTCTVPANLHVRPFLPQGALLNRCHLVVTHGGAGSVLGALRYGVPMVVIPLGADQDGNADEVESAGAGLKVDAGAAPRTLRAAVTKVLDGSRFRAAARTLRAEIADMPQPAAVIPVLAELADF